MKLGLYSGVFGFDHLRGLTDAELSASHEVRDPLREKNEIVTTSFGK